MPELPEVETIRRDLERGIRNKTIVRVHVLDKRVLRQPQADFIRRLEGQMVRLVERRGKALVLTLGSGEYLVVQVMMTGQMVLNGAANPHTRVKFEISGGDGLLYNDQRVFGQLRVVKDLREVKYFQILGPEPFTQNFSEEYIAAYLKKSKRPIKNILLDHTFVAGVGNIYACEILFRCRISPKRRAHRIKPAAEVPVLRAQTIAVLKEAIALRGSSMRNYRDGAGQKGAFSRRLRVYAKENGPCSICRNPIARIV
ncbi:MAG: bifunctional DNA-formamidopyrimidine glycosylase/DNA-(apurinic or apyrimidinic site) lyase, partial [Candidatus Omnitrophica bacterium]|nr:bifunctional DNA-formamidopyrimidine glycosylase/DNA-(apurinic or apyrimidinic site) lyase [Candidatus Omnitrophota bacterium]